MSALIGSCASTEPEPLLPAAIVAASAVSLSGVAGDPVSSPPSVKVTNAAGMGVPDVPVTFSVAGGGSITGEIATTDAEGVASVGGWTLGPLVGTNTLTAMADGLPAVSFTAVSVAGPPATVVIQTPPSSSTAAGVAFATQPVVQLQDVNGNPSPTEGVVVAATLVGGEGVLGGTTTVATNGSGVATFTDLSVDGRVGPRTLAFDGVGLTGASASVTVTAGAPAAVMRVGDDPASVIAGAALNDSVRVEVTDASGNAISGITVTFAVVAGGGSIAPLSTLTDADGQAAAHWVTGTNPGPNSATASVAGLTPVTFSITTTPVPVASISISPDSSGMPIGSTQPLVPLLHDAEGNVLSGRTVTWTSGNSSVATVNAGGIVTANALGNTTITASSEGKTATVTVAVEHRQRVTTGDGFGCALTTSGQAYCWGNNVEGSLGIGEYGSFSDPASFKTTPTPVAGGLRFKAISAGGGHVVALTTDGVAYAWGRNLHGQLGVGDSVSRNVPTLVATSLRFASVSVGGEHVVALTADGTAYAWGFNVQGGVGDGTQVNRVAPVAVATDLKFTSVAAGGSNVTVALTAGGHAYAWGTNNSGVLGDGSAAARSLVPVAVAGGHSFASVFVASEHVYALTSAGTLYSWGSNYCGQLGDGATADRNTPQAIATHLVFKQASGGAASGVALTASGAAYTWGLNNAGQAGNGRKSPNNTCLDGSGSLVPEPVLGGLTFESVAGNGAHVYAITSSGVAYSWGHGTLGELGDGSRIDRLTPVLVVGGLIFK